MFRTPTIAIACALLLAAAAWLLTPRSGTRTASDPGARATPASGSASIPRPRDWERLVPAVRERVRDAVRRCEAEPRSPAALTALGRVYHGNGEHALALAAYEAALALGAEDPQTPYLAGVLHETSGRSDRAVRYLALAIERRPDYAPAHFHLGRVHLEAGDLDAATSALRQAVQLQPDDADFHAALARALRLADRPHEAATAARRALALDPSHGPAHQVLGLALRALGDPRAGEHLQRVGPQRDEVVRDPWLGEVQKEVATVEGVTSLARSLLAAGRVDAAIAALQPLAEAHPRRGDVQRLLARACARGGLDDRAIAALRQALDIDPHDVEALVALATLHVRQADHASARAVVDRALAVDPDSAEVLALHGGLLLQDGAAEEAVAVLQSALTRRRDSVLAHVSLGDALLALDRRGEALAAYERAAALQPGWDYPRRQIARLRAARAGGDAP